MAAAFSTSLDVVFTGNNLHLLPTSSRGIFVGAVVPTCSWHFSPFFTTARWRRWRLLSSAAVRDVINICLWSTLRGWRPCENKTTTLTSLTTAASGAWTKHGFPWLCHPPSLLPLSAPSPLLSFFLPSSHLLSIITSHLLFLFPFHFLSVFYLPSSFLSVLLPLFSSTYASTFLSLLISSPHPPVLTTSVCFFFLSLLLLLPPFFSQNITPLTL